MNQATLHPHFIGHGEYLLSYDKCRCLIFTVVGLYNSLYLLCEVWPVSKRSGAQCELRAFQLFDPDQVWLMKPELLTMPARKL